ncbi:hypothetical protein MLD38_034249 [Melastoma candidum]|uniref:Uncharacterized protein n=1 Tax=Melastoma candidum TaxID=119954 RepID=A0ACB9M8Z8_9MYRT|nr:hypothetical protein MLD38_034249 [Melastoma candidum]
MTGEDFQKWVYFYIIVYAIIIIIIIIIIVINGFGRKGMGEKQKRTRKANWVGWIDGGWFLFEIETLLSSPLFPFAFIPVLFFPTPICFSLIRSSFFYVFYFVIFFQNVKGVMGM